MSDTEEKQIGKEQREITESMKAKDVGPIIAERKYIQLKTDGKDIRFKCECGKELFVLDANPVSITVTMEKHKCQNQEETSSKN